MHFSDQFPLNVSLLRFAVQFICTALLMLLQGDEILKLYSGAIWNLDAAIKFCRIALNEQQQDAITSDCRAAGHQRMRQLR